MDYEATGFVSRQSVSKWESDIAFPETEKLIALSKLYHCTIDYLLNIDNNDITSETNSFNFLIKLL